MRYVGELAFQRLYPCVESLRRLKSATAALSCAVLMALLAGSGAWAATNPTTQTLDFQGYLRDASGTEVNGPVTITFRIYNAATAGSQLWTETQALTVVNGSFFANLGSSTTNPLPF